jgi:hypothetical protein
MALTADILITPQPIVMPVAPQPRPAIVPATERESASNQRRGDAKNPNSALSFRAALSAATVANVGTASQGAEAVWTDGVSERQARPVRLPEHGPIELSGAEAADLFARAVANNERKGRSPVFAAATSRYATSYFAGSSFHARPGQTLELTA